MINRHTHEGERWPMLGQISRRPMRSGDSGDAKPTLPDAEMISSAPRPLLSRKGMVRGTNKDQR